MYSTGRELIRLWSLIHFTVVKITEERLKQLIDTEHSQYMVGLQPFW